MQHVTVVKATPLPNIAGRSNYISSPDRQENLVSVCDYLPEVNTAGNKSFDDLLDKYKVHIDEQSKYLTKSNEADGKKMNEGMEYMIKLDNKLDKVDPELLSNELAKIVMKATGQNCAQVALHYNKSKTNYHAHVIIMNHKYEETAFSMSKNPEKTNRYYDANGKRSSKAKCTDDNGKLLPGCQYVKKGQYRILSGAKYFNTKKLSLYQNKQVLDNIKEDVTQLQNKMLKEEIYISKPDPEKIKQASISKGLSKEIEASIREHNKQKQKYNAEVDAYKETLDFAEANNVPLSENDINLLYNNKVKFTEAIRNDNAYQFALNQISHHDSYNNAIVASTNDLKEKNKSLLLRVMAMIKQHSIEENVKKLYGLTKDKFNVILTKLNNTNQQALKINDWHDKTDNNHTYRQLRNCTLQSLEDMMYDDIHKTKIYDINKQTRIIKKWSKMYQEVGLDGFIPDDNLDKYAWYDFKNDKRKIINTLFDKIKEINQQYNTLKEAYNTYHNEEQQATATFIEQEQQLYKADSDLCVCAFDYDIRDSQHKVIVNMVEYDEAIERTKSPDVVEINRDNWALTHNQISWVEYAKRIKARETKKAPEVTKSSNKQQSSEKKSRINHDDFSMHM